MQGYRLEMEDQHIHTKMPGAEDHLFLGVFDGHGGKGCAIYVAGTDPSNGDCSLTTVITEQAEWRQYLASSPRDISLLKRALERAFIDIDARMQEFCNKNPAKSYTFGGCTAVTVMITPEWIVCANAGDSRATMSKRGSSAITLSEDHKPENPEEMRRIVAAGGQVHNKRVDGNLAVSRGLGDFEFKLDTSKGPEVQKVSCVPEFYEYPRDRDNEEMIIIACDGLWDVFTNDEAVEEVRRIWEEGEKDIRLVAEEMLDMSLKKKSEDNISAIVVRLANADIAAEGPGVQRRRDDRMSEAQANSQEFGNGK